MSVIRLCLCLFLLVFALPMTASADEPAPKDAPPAAEKEGEKEKIQEGRSCEGPCDCGDGVSGTKGWMAGKCFCHCEVQEFDPELAPE